MHRQKRTSFHLLSTIYYHLLECVSSKHLNSLPGLHSCRVPRNTGRTLCNIFLPWFQKTPAKFGHRYSAGLLLAANSANHFLPQIPPSYSCRGFQSTQQNNTHYHWLRNKLRGLPNKLPQAFSESNTPATLLPSNPSVPSRMQGPQTE